jgi:hypothetical protein
VSEASSACIPKKVVWPIQDTRCHRHPLSSPPHQTPFPPNPPQCKLGRMYLTTAPHLDGVRNLFTFDTEALASYELGAYEHVCDVPDAASPAAAAAEAPPPADIQSVSVEMTKASDGWRRTHSMCYTYSGGTNLASDRVGAVASLGCCPAAVSDETGPVALWSVQLQNLMLVFHDRISNLEKPKETPGGGSESQADTSAGRKRKW